MDSKSQNAMQLHDSDLCQIGQGFTDVQMRTKVPPHHSLGRHKASGKFSIHTAPLSAQHDG